MTRRTIKPGADVVGLAAGGERGEGDFGDFGVGDEPGRGLDTTAPILVGIDGVEALHAGIMAVVDHPVIQRCQMHKLRNVADKLPDDLAAAVTKQMRAAYHAPSAIIASPT